MRKMKNLIGEKFGRLLVIERSEDYIQFNGKKRSYWKCRCECGKEKKVSSDNLVSGKIKSCGCLKKEKTVLRSYKHGLVDTKLYKTWCNMKDRCYNKNNTFFYRYGGRGIKLCDEWKNDFKCFYDWSIKNGYSEKLTIDRKDNDKNYCPENCRWVNLKEQARNTSRNKIILWNGETKCLSEWEEITGLPIKKRLRDGWSLEKSFLTPKRKRTERKQNETFNVSIPCV